MSVKTDTLADLNEQLATIEASIKTVVENGQGFRKGGVSSFAVEQAKLSQLRAERTELKAKIATWELYE